jgi:predicted glycoside hydrolase/deacetylase ChbG (UPF0249 family)
MAEERILIVNADDFGLSHGINRGIIAAHERGIVTSASLMTRWPGAAEAAAYARAHPRLSVGLHLDLGEWTYSEGGWLQLYRVLPDDAGTPQIAAEIRRQLAAFRELIGCDPSHVDSHQHCHRADPVRSIAIALSDELRLPLREFTPGIGYCGAFYGQSSRGEPFHEGIGVDNLLSMIGELQPGVTEFSCHPGGGDDCHSIYRAERAIEAQTLCAPAVLAYLKHSGIHLTSFREIWNHKLQA